MPHGIRSRHDDVTPNSRFHDQGKFGRMFGSLPPFQSNSPTVRAALVELGRKGGRMDALDDLDAPPVDLILKPEKFVNNPDNPTMTAGMTFLGQFLDHDVTLDITSSLEQQVDPESIKNFRTPAFELDNVYGLGPAGSPHLYDQTVDGGATTMLVEENPGSAALTRDGKVKFDLPRNSQGTPLIGDPRNDENMVLSQLQVAWLKFHNAVVQRVKAESGLVNPNDIFTEAQRLVRWHYQWIIVHEFLPQTIGSDMLREIRKKGRKFFKWNNAPYIPVEFSVAAYRFGHSQVRPSYRANFGPNDANQFFALLFDDRLPASNDPNDMRGGHRAPRRFIDWQTFFAVGNPGPRNNKRIDTKLSSVLLDLPGMPAGELQSLASRNLIRHLTFRVPSGQRVAKAMGLDALSARDLDDVRDLGLHTSTPLWYYILHEADVAAQGKHLGPVGGRIVGEVFLGLLEGDSMSYLRQDPDWKPTLGTGDDFTIADMLRFAGVVTAM